MKNENPILPPPYPANSAPLFKSNYFQLLETIFSILLLIISNFIAL